MSEQSVDRRRALAARWLGVGLASVVAVVTLGLVAVCVIGVVVLLVD